MRFDGQAKIQFRGVPTKKRKWFSGCSMTRKDVDDALGGLDLNVSKDSGIGEKYYWCWIVKYQHR